MKTFYDKSERNWKIALNLGVVKRVMDATGINLLNPADDCGNGQPLSVRLLMDDLFFGNIVAEIIKPQCFEHKIEEKDLLDVFDAETLKAAQVAFNEEYADFFERRGNAACLKILRASQAARDQAMIEAMNSLDDALNGQTSSDSQAEPDATASES